MARSRTVAATSSAINLALLAARLVCGIIFMGHGAQKVFGAFGGPGLATLTSPDMMGPLGYPVAIGEFFGGLALVLGLFSRFSAFWLIVIMIGAIVQVHGKNGFFLQNQGYEYNLALIGLCAVTLLAGPGAYSIAAAIRRLPAWLH